MTLYCYKILLRLIDVVKSAVLCGLCNFVKQQLWLEFTNFVKKLWDFFHHKQFITPFKVIFWSETVKTNVSTKVGDSNINWLICQICLMIFSLCKQELIKYFTKVELNLHGLKERWGTRTECSLFLNFVFDCVSRKLLPDNFLQYFTSLVFWSK